MRNYLKTLIYFIVFFVVAADLRADMLITNSGRELKGTILKIDDNTVTVSADNEETVFKKDDILSIKFTKDTAFQSAISLTSLNDDLLNNVIPKKVSPESYPNAGYIKLYSEIRLKYTKDGEFTSSYRDITQVLKDRGKDAGVVSMSYKKDVQTAKVIHGRTINDDGKVYDYDQSSLRESSMFFRYPDYDKVNSIKFPLSNVVVGSVLDYAYSITQHEIDAFEPVYKNIYFSSYEPVLKKKLVIMVPKGSEKIKVSLRLMGVEGEDYTFKEEDAGDYTVYTYEKDNIKSVEEESYMPSDHMIMPRVVLSLSPGFDEITKEYSEKLKEVLDISDDIKDKVTGLTNGADSIEDKVFNIYDYIVKEINLLHVGIGHYSYIPNRSDYTYSKKAGNSLDKTFLLYAFLKAADIDCEFALVKRRNKGDILDENPCIKQFDYPVVIVPLDTNTLYISGLDKYLMITDIDGSIQGGKGLVVSKTGGKVIDIPLNHPDKENTFRSFEINLFEDGAINVKERKTIRGNSQASLRMFHYIPEKRLNKYLLESAYRIHPNANLIDYKFENLNDLKKIPEMEMSYSIKDYMISAGGKLLAFKMPSLSYSAYGVGKKERIYPLSFGELTSNNNEYVLRLPDNYKIYYLPEKYSYKSDNFVYEASFEVHDDKILFKDSYRRLSAFAPMEAYFELKECLETRAKLAKEWIVIEKE
jgi:hypothetical protein